MNRFTRIGFIFTLTLVLLFPLQVSSSTEAPDAMSVKGQVLSFANPAQSKSISVDIAKKGVMVFKYDKRTEFSADGGYSIMEW